MELFSQCLTVFHCIPLPKVPSAKESRGGLDLCFLTPWLPRNMLSDQGLQTKQFNQKLEKGLTASPHKTTFHGLCFWYGRNMLIIPCLVHPVVHFFSVFSLQPPLSLTLENETKVLSALALVCLFHQTTTWGPADSTEEFQHLRERCRPMHTDSTLLSTKNLSFLINSCKLAPCFIVPFPEFKIINPVAVAWKSIWTQPSNQTPTPP